MMSLAQVRGYLEQAKQEGVQDYYITGGEVFINPEIFEILAAILEYGPLNVLTNATLITPAKARQLAGIRDAAEHPLQFRISMEHFDEAENDKVRGSGSYAKPSRVCAIWPRKLSLPSSPSPAVGMKPTTPSWKRNFSNS